MRLAISNIAWETSQDNEVLKLLQKYGIDAIDVAPGKYFPDIMNTTDQQIKDVKIWWADRGIEITGMQALLFGTKNLNLFGSKVVQKSMLQHLNAVCRIASVLGAPRLVFGSPKNRDRSGLSNQEAIDIAIPFFRSLGDIALNYNILMCLEPNPTSYGANFMTTSIETATIVEQVAHPAIKMQFDTGALTINQENPSVILKNYAHLIGHIHASEPNLVPLGEAKTDHNEIYKALQQYLPNKLISIEMLTEKNGSFLMSIDKALDKAVRSYCPNEIKSF